MSEGGSPAALDLDDLFNYDVGLDEIVPDKTVHDHDNNTNAGTGDSAIGLGLDEEVKVTKKRQPVAKLDEARLLSQPGIPKLRQSAKRKLRFKGKGHEFSDATRLLNFYQLWLDDLYPRAKFADGLSIIEKLGHSKRIQVMRREWIEEEKPRLLRDSGITREELENSRVLQTPAKLDEAPSSNIPGQEGSPEDLFMPNNGNAQPTISHPEPEEDDLDDLLREEPMADIPPNTSISTREPQWDEDFDDDYEAMKELGM
ncbi:unnamed protein product [Penicillium olsonii]|uniref:Chromosome segregation in meiosis protein n=1 Tax=Penicillium olsonii TaxID=99116 RepID=A0A9W4MQZ2_PENOL|nr:unnamed protein product [Penicillium olsonii]CAG8275028.1 unnamed protein product [Penicillium olsonii]